MVGGSNNNNNPTTNNNNNNNIIINNEDKDGSGDDNNSNTGTLTAHIILAAHPHDSPYSGNDNVDPDDFINIYNNDVSVKTAKSAEEMLGMMS